MRNIKTRIKHLEKKIPDGYQETLDFLTLSWRITNSALPRLDPPPEVLRKLETQARELVANGETLSIRRLLKKIDWDRLATASNGG